MIFISLLIIITVVKFSFNAISYDVCIGGRLQPCGPANLRDAGAAGWQRRGLGCPNPKGLGNDRGRCAGPAALLPGYGCAAALWVAV